METGHTSLADGALAQTATGLASRQWITIATKSPKENIRTDLNGNDTDNAHGLRRHKNTKIGTWNLSGLCDKEPPIIEFMKDKGIHMIGLSDVRKKGTGCKVIHNNYVLIWTGPPIKERAKHGVGFIVDPEKAKNITNIEHISERIMSIRLLEGNQYRTYIQIYAPCNDSYPEEERQEFFETLSDHINKIKNNDEVIIMGDFNGRVGPTRAPWRDYLGPHSDHDTPCNSNGEKLLSLCAEFNLCITNTLFQHRKSHIKTWYKWNDLSVSSQIDFILASKKMRSIILDARAIANHIIDTDHKLVVLILRNKDQHKTIKRKTKTQKIIQRRKLSDTSVKEKICKAMSKKFEELPAEVERIDREWLTFKNALMDTLKKECGTKELGKTKRKGTIWWNDAVKEATKQKKLLYKKWAKTKDEGDLINYKEARKAAKRLIKSSKENSWARYGIQLSDLCKTNSREFYKSVKSMRIRDEVYNPIHTINDKNGETITNKATIRNRWQEYFQDLLNPNGELPLQQHTMQPNTGTQDTSTFPILTSEIEETLKNSPQNKSPGPDEISTEAISACGEAGIAWLHRIFNAAWNQRQCPEDWRNSVVVPIWKKKGNKNDCNTYRGISLLSHSGKMYAKILERRTRQIVDTTLSQAQFGFRKGRGCTDAIFALRQICEKAIEHNKEIDLVFVDQEKAFDRVDREKLWITLTDYGVDGELLANIKALYVNSKSRVRTKEGSTEWFDVTSGVRQGCVLSPLLFIVYMDKITQEANTHPEQLNELLFADDQSLIHPDKDSLQAHATRLNNACNKYGMKISTAKTEVMQISNTQSTLDININNQTLKQVDEFKYLGSIFTSDGKMDREIEARIQKANRVTYQLAPLLSHRIIPMEAKRELIKSVFIPTLCYQCQTWTLSKAQQSKITACEMKCLRKTLNITRRDRVRNDEVRQLVGIEPCTSYIERQQIKWFGHLVRMQPHQPALRAYNLRYNGFKARGRPRKRWIDGISSVLGKHRMTAQEATQKAHARCLHLPSTLNGTRGQKK